MLRKNTTFVSISVASVPRQSPDRRELPNHSRMLAALVLRDILLSLLVDLFNLLSDESQPLHGKLNFGKAVRVCLPA